MNIMFAPQYNVLHDPSLISAIACFILQLPPVSFNIETNITTVSKIYRWRIKLLSFSAEINSNTTISE